MKSFKLGLGAAFVALALSGCQSDLLSHSKSDSKIIYVDQHATAGAHNGTSWNNAYVDLQNALAAAKPGDQIWVSEGTYYPTNGSDRSDSFKMVSGVELIGGFSGKETLVTQRNWQKNKTILSGNIGDKNDQKDNSYHVVVGANNAVLDGFIVEDGYAMVDLSKMPPPRGSKPPTGPKGPTNHTSPAAITSGPSNGVGAGLLNYQAAPIVRNTTFENNYAMKGGAVYNMTSQGTRISDDNPSPVFINTMFSNNFAQGRGGAVSNDLSTDPIFINCQFVANSTADKGGAMYNDFGSSPIVLNSQFTQNKAMRAAAFGVDGSSRPILINVSIENNQVSDIGAGIYQGSYNAADSGIQNITYVINSKVLNNHSATNGAANWMNWGDDEIKTWGSDIGNWNYGDTMSVQKRQEFASLVNLSETLKKTAC